MLKVVPRFPTFISEELIAFSIYPLKSPDLSFSGSVAGL